MKLELKQRYYRLLEAIYGDFDEVPHEYDATALLSEIDKLPERLRMAHGGISAARQRLPIIIKMRWGLEDNRAKTLRELAEYFEVTPERIRQQEAKALRMLRHPSTQIKVFGATLKDLGKAYQTQQKG